MPTPKKLPLARLEELRGILRTGMPGYDQPGIDKVYELDEALTDMLRKEHTRLGFKGMRSARRHYYAIAEINGYVNCDGSSVGVAQNEPEILPVAQRAAKAMKLGQLARVLAAAVKCMPPRRLMGSRNSTHRFDWYDRGPGLRFASRLSSWRNASTKPNPRMGTWAPASDSPSRTPASSSP